MAQKKPLLAATSANMRFTDPPPQVPVSAGKRVEAAVIAVSATISIIALLRLVFISLLLLIVVGHGVGLVFLLVAFVPWLELLPNATAPMLPCACGSSFH